VFVNSIDSIRRIVPLFELLGVKVWGIHAEMQQRQRLKNLARFSEEKHCVLISSDVSARGLDIPEVDHVVHYQIPRTADLYVHRSGRTARGGKEGVVVSLCGPAEIKAYRRICHGLQKGGDLPDFPVDYSVLNGIAERLKIAKEIDTSQHKLEKKTHDMSWLRKMATDGDMSLDEEEYALSL
jgi:ATP-dependent RNA helicase DDX24/MAK5